MKPITTWIVLANARHVSVVSHPGLGKGLHVLKGVQWHSNPVGLPRDEAGIGHSIGGPGIAALEQTDHQELADAQFAKTVCDDLQKAKSKAAFDRLVVVAGPHMMGLIRKALSPDLKQAVHAEIAKDLSGQPMQKIETHVGEVMAV